MLKQLLPELPRSQALELLDQPQTNLPALAKNLQDLVIADLLIGATQTLWVALKPHLPSSTESTEPLTLLDLATGSAVAASRLAQIARRHGYDIYVYGSDLQRAILRLARPIPLICHDALAIPAANASIDYITCGLALHHFAPAEAAQLIAEMARVARRAALIVDLQRTRLGYLGAQCMAHGPWGRMARHDGPLSVLRAYTPTELTEICQIAGVKADIRTHGPLLVSVVVGKV